MNETIIQLDAVRIERHKPRKCTCDVRKFSVDTVNREITCGCGLTVDPFEAMEYLARHVERINEAHKALHEQRVQWFKEKPHSVIFKDLERNYQRGTMLPACPKCDATIDFKELKFWRNAEFYRKLEANRP